MKNYYVKLSCLSYYGPDHLDLGKRVYEKAEYISTSKETSIRDGILWALEKIEDIKKSVNKHEMTALRIGELCLGQIDTRGQCTTSYGTPLYMWSEVKNTTTLEEELRRFI